MTWIIETKEGTFYKLKTFTVWPDIITFMQGGEVIRLECDKIKSIKPQ